MSQSEGEARERFKREVALVSGEFALAAQQAREGVLAARVAHLVQSENSHFDRLGPDATAAFRRAAARAIARTAREIAERLTDSELWENPTVRLAYREERDHGEGLEEQAVESGWIKALPEPRLDHPDNRVWILLLNGADALDPVAIEFGLQPSDFRDPGGGHFGLQPQSALELDPSGRLDRLWKRYVEAYRIHQHEDPSR